MSDRTITMMYVGQTEHGHHYVPEDLFEDFAENGTVHTYKKALQRGQFVGGIYRFHHPEGKDTIILNSGEYVGSVYTGEHPEALVDRVDLRKVMTRTWQQMKRDKEYDGPVEGLKPWRAAFERATTAERRHILTTVLSYIQTGRLS